MLQSNLLLMCAAAIWGFGFVAQRLGLEHLGPYGFNGVRFWIGALSLLPLLFWQARARGLQGAEAKTMLQAALPVGLLLFIGASFQQVALQYTTAAKAGFITGLYLVLVPLLGLWLRHKTSLNTWCGGLVALAGLYFLSVAEDFSVNYGDILLFIGAFFWAGHLLSIDHFAGKMTPVLLAVLQFIVCGSLSLAVAVCVETISLPAIQASLGPLLYAGVVATGVAYTLQIIGQRQAHPAHAAIILSLETVFAAVGGVWLLGETLTSRALLGCALMLAGMFLSQLPLRWLLRAWRLPETNR
jgi:drug/metabolite transporter (DMT)-like permease